MSLVIFALIALAWAGVGVFVALALGKILHRVSPAIETTPVSLSSTSITP